MLSPSRPSSFQGLTIEPKPVAMLLSQPRECCWFRGMLCQTPPPPKTWHLGFSLQRCASDFFSCGAKSAAECRVNLLACACALPSFWRGDVFFRSQLTPLPPPFSKAYPSHEVSSTLTHLLSSLGCSDLCLGSWQSPSYCCFSQGRVPT